MLRQLRILPTPLRRSGRGLGFRIDGATWCVIRVRVSLGLIHRSRYWVSFIHRSRRRPPDVRKVADDFLSADHVRVVVGAKRLEAAGPEANRRVAQSVVVCEQRARDGKLIELLRKRYPQGGSSSHYMRSRLIVFGLYKKECARLEADLNRKGWRCVAIHGDMSQAATARA